MKIGVFTVLFQQKPLEEALDYIVESGVEMVELGTGNYPGNAHCDPDRLLGNKTAQKELLKAIESRGLAISALSCHGNPLHPNSRICEGSSRGTPEDSSACQRVGSRYSYKLLWLSRRRTQCH
jgi:sugar phosphate isomerase/epimerase